jgi:hypothetical protein
MRTAISSAGYCRDAAQLSSPRVKVESFDLRLPSHRRHSTIGRLAGCVI